MNDFSQRSPLWTPTSRIEDVQKAIDDGEDVHEIRNDRSVLDVLADRVYTCEHLAEKTRLFLKLGVSLEHDRRGLLWSPLDEMNHHPLARSYTISFDHHRASHFIDLLLSEGAQLHQIPRHASTALALLKKGCVFKEASSWFEHWETHNSGHDLKCDQIQALKKFGIELQETVPGEDRFVSLLKASKKVSSLLPFVESNDCHWTLDDLVQAAGFSVHKINSYDREKWLLIQSGNQQKEINQQTPQVSVSRRASRL